MSELSDVAVVVGYALLVLLVGATALRRQDTPEGFFLGGRSLGLGQFLATTFGTFFGTGLVFTLASFGYLYGVGAFGLSGAAALGFVLFARAAPRIKAASDESGAITLPALFADVWTAKTRAAAALVTLALFAGTLAANFLVVGELLHAFYEFPKAPAIGGVGLVVLAYTLLGGFQGVVRTDVLQTGVILATLVVVLPAVLFLGDGTPALESLPSGHLDPLTLPGQLLVVYLLIGVFAYFGSQDLFQRVYAVSDEQLARRGVLAFSVMVFVVSAVAVGLGIGVRALFPAVPADRALVTLTTEVVSDGATGIAVLGFLALANAGADSKLLTVTSNVTEDLLPHLDPVVGDRTQVLLHRLVLVGVGLVALVLAVAAPSLTALFTGLGAWFAVLGVVVVATLYWDRMTDTAAFTGLIVGFLAPTLFVAVTGNFQVATAVGLVPAVVATVAVSLLTEPDSRPAVTDDVGKQSLR